MLFMIETIMNANFSDKIRNKQYKIISKFFKKIRFINNNNKRIKYITKLFV